MTARRGNGSSRSRERKPRAPARPKLAVWKFASCDGCQLSLLDCEDELMAVADVVQVANFLEASREVVKGPYDLSLVEGSITTPHDAERIHLVRRVSKTLVTIGACATSGGLQALRNYANVADWVRMVYASPQVIETLKTSTAISNHVRVDYELNGCPVDKRQLLEVVNAFLHGHRPSLPGHSVCMECKQRGAVCVTVARGTPCLGPVTHAGCGALCPAYHRGCYGCFGPARGANTDALGRVFLGLGATHADLARAFRSFHAAADPFRRASEHHERLKD
jgi:coenzyme F420-reducing hydrogenase gamma subunit